jgi:ribosomal protein L7Ae-like RNA K-turn-binding protein
MERSEAKENRSRTEPLDTTLIMAADTISGYIQGLPDGIEYKQTAYEIMPSQFSLQAWANISFPSVTRSYGKSPANVMARAALDIEPCSVTMRDN